MDKKHIIRRWLEKIGNTVELIDGEWTSTPFKAVVSPLWRKKNSLFEKIFTEIGSDINEYFLYVGPASHDITALSEEVLLVSGDKKYEFKHRDAMMLSDEVLYYEGILRLVKEGDYDNNQ